MDFFALLKEEEERKRRARMMEMELALQSPEMGQTFSKPIPGQYVPKEYPTEEERRASRALIPNNSLDKLGILRYEDGAVTGARSLPSDVFGGLIEQARVDRQGAPISSFVEDVFGLPVYTLGPRSLANERALNNMMTTFKESGYDVEASREAFDTMQMERASKGLLGVPRRRDKGYADPNSVEFVPGEGKNRADKFGIRGGANTGGYKTRKTIAAAAAAAPAPAPAASASGAATPSTKSVTTTPSAGKR